MSASKKEQSGQTKLSAQQKASTTHEAAMQIIDAESRAREKKTERLRALREQREASNAEEAAATKPRATKARRKP